ncbi:MAG: SIMPL domain-containing protein [Gammaproteobacteria bacterium]|nr:SIMPL domain-containing protein [Gammaproteobacteria bacterium]
MIVLRVLLISLFATALFTPAQAEQMPRYNQINIQASASQELANDQLTANLMVQQSGKNPAKLANQVNQKMAIILEKSHAFNAIKTKTTSYSTIPVYKNGVIESWQVSQNIMLTSQDFDALAEFVGQLNELATVQSMTFSISQQAIDDIKDELTKQAISNFKNKAKMIAQQFDKVDYVLVKVSIDSNYYQPQAKMGRVMMIADAESAPPALAAGTDNVSAHINGTIELLSD